MTPAALILAAAAVSPPNLLLVTIDTLRADRLRCYGYAAAETPAADRLAREGVLLEDATVQAPQTRPSHASILTGRYPYEHGIRDNFSPPLAADRPTLATVLRARGYDTAAFIGGFPLSAASGLNRGFKLYDDDLSGSGHAADPGTLAERRAGVVVDRAVRWLARPRTQPFFAWVHLFDPHAPYEPPAPFDRQYRGRPYDGEVAYADSQLARLVEYLDQRKLRERTLVVVTADHGEGLGDHGEDEHLMLVYDSTLRVPLLASWPTVLPAGRRIGGPFRSIDLLPTVLELLGQPAVPATGASRAAALRARTALPEVESYAETLYGHLHFGYAPLRALRAEGWKYIDAPRAELFRIRDDPGERTNLIELRGTVAERMRERLAGYDKGTSTPVLAAPTDAGAIERLAALGYVGGGGSRRGAAVGADPKDKIAEHQTYLRDLREAMRRQRAGDLDGALPILLRLSRDPASVSFEVQYFLGRGLLRKRRYAEAADALEEARRLMPAMAAVWVDLARAFRLQGKLGEARAVTEKGLAQHADKAALWQERGLVLQQAGDLAGARGALEKARTLDPAAAQARLALSAIYRDTGRTDDAVSELREAVRRAPGFGDGWNALGVLLTELGRTAEAERAYRAALDAHAEDPDVLFNLAGLLARTGRGADALPLLEKLAEVAPRFPGALEALESARRDLARAASGSLHVRLLRVADRATVEAAARRLATGEDFAAVARAVSVDASAAQGGDLGAVDPAELAEPLRSALAALSPGQVSAILETAAGYVILKREK
jgi:arylsulfatase A-like enzyme/tetratricopeptide (TPR) repeat protein